MGLFKWLFNQPYLLLSITTLCWAGNAIAGKIAVGHISPFLLTSIRWILAMAIIVPIAMPHLKREWPIIKKHFPFLFALGAIGFATFNNFMYLSLTHTSAINVAIIQAAMPLIVFILNFTLFAIKATNKQFFGFLLTVVGILTIASKGNFENVVSMNFNYGDLLILVAIMIYGTYTVFLKNKPNLHWMSFISVLGLSAVATSIPYAMFEAANNTIIWPDTTGYIVIIYTAIFPSLIAQVFWIRGIEIIGSNAGGVFINLVPILGTALAIIILREQLHLFHIIAMVLVIGGVWIAQQKTAR